MSKYTVTEEAEADIKDVGRYTNRVWGRDQRIKYIAELGMLLGRLAKNPELGKDYGYVLDGCFGYIYQHHIVFCTKASYGIEIIRVLHQTMDIESRLLNH